MRISNKYIYLLFMLLCTLSVSAQKEERKNIRQGNKLYENEQYTEAEIAYRKALEVNAHSPQSQMNLGNALYRQEKTQEALQQYQALTNDEENPERQANAYHNMGNVLMQAQDYANAVKAYQQSLIKRPSDNETRYNLALAQALLKQQEQQNQQQQEQQQEQEQEQQEQQQEQPQEQQQEQNQQEQQQEQPQDAREQISKEQAQQLLDALMQDEQEVQDKVKELQMQQSQGRKIDKDW